MSDIVKQVQEISNQQLLTEIIEAAKKRITQLENIPVRLVLHDGTWYAVMPDKTAVNLGTKQTTAMLRASINKKAPDPLDYAISEAEAHQRITAGQHVGWVESDTFPPRRNYYSLPEYRAAVESYKQWHSLVTDPNAMIYGFSANAIHILRTIESRGHTIDYP